MLCNVCGEDKRCYSLLEAELRGTAVRPAGMIFSICSSCLDSLISSIKTGKTKIDKEEDVLDSEHAITKLDSQKKKTK